MTEAEARATITRWAKQHFSENDEHITPEVEVVSIRYDKGEDEWTAELDVSTSADNPTITFFMDERPGYGLQIATIEY